VKHTLLTRLRRLEGRDAEGHTTALVIRLELDGQPETPWTDMDPARPLIVLPRKAASAEEWAQWVRQRWPEYGGRGEAQL
jgi:hypothetical protein